MTPLIYQSCQAPWQQGGLVLLKIVFSSKMKQSVEKRGKKSEMWGLSCGRQPRHLSSSCYCSCLGNIWVSPQFAKDESPVAQAQKTEKGKVWRGLSSTNPGSAHWRRSWGPVKVAKLIWECTQFELSGFVSRKSLSDTWSSRGWKKNIVL